MKTPLSATLASALLLGASRAHADPPPVKVCVAVAGDPDETVRQSAETVVDAVSHHAALRGVADADARAALRGEGAAPADFADLATARRALRGEDRDAATLDPVAARLGCGLVVEVMARPAGTLVRVYDAVSHAWAAPRELATVDASVTESVIVPALAARNVPAAAGAAAAGATAARPGASDRRVTAPTSQQRSAWSRVWPWAVVGGVALAVVGVYFLTSDGPSSSTTTINVFHRGSTP